MPIQSLRPPPLPRLDPWPIRPIRVPQPPRVYWPAVAAAGAAALAVITGLAVWMACHPAARAKPVAVARVTRPGPTTPVPPRHLPPAETKLALAVAPGTPGRQGGRLAERVENTDPRSEPATLAPVTVTHPRSLPQPPPAAPEVRKEEPPAAPRPAPTPPPLPVLNLAAEAPAACELPAAAPPAAPVRRTYGTRVAFARSPEEAARQAKKEMKLVFVLHVSGNFEDSRFT